MTIYRSSGKNTEIYEEYELYTREYTENVGGKSTFIAKGGTTYGNKPETAKPLEITNLYVKVRLNDNYNGEFGFDWIDVNPETKEIEKIQDVPFSEVEYFYKKGATPTDLGDIVATSTDPIGAKHAIQDHYNFNPVSKHIDIPFALIKCDQEITLSAEIILWQGEIKDDIITITGDEFYEFDIIGGEKEGKTAKIKLTKAGKIDFKVKCLEEGSEKKYEFKHSNPVTGSHSVGGLTMMENNELKLKFRVIALVSSDGNPNEKAKALFKKFKDNKISDYLNKNSLNQAGYKVEIENYDEMDNSDVDDYLYAFNKEDWKTKQLFKEQYNKKYWDKVLKPDGSYELEPDGKHYKMVLTDNPPKPIDILTEDEIDYKTIEAYKTKLISKSKTYNGGLLILSDHESPSQTVAFSRTTPLDHYALLIYSNGIEKQENYAHEIGHMLGLPHSFYMDKEKEAYNNARENVLGNGLPEKNPNGTNNVKYRAGINRNIQKVKDEAKNSNLSDIYRPTSVTAIKNDIIKYLNNFNKIYSIKVNKEKTDKKHIETTYVNYRDNDKINQTQTKGEYLSIYNKNIKRWNDYIDENEKAIVEVNKYKGNKFETIKTNLNFIRPDYIILLEETKKYYLNIISQTHSNYIIFKKSSTKNMMDYENEKMRFLHNQVKIMRDDMQNY